MKKRMLLIFILLAGGVLLLLKIYPTVNQTTLEVHRSIVVLPLSKVGDSTRYDYFSDGVTEDIINTLSRAKELTVTAWNASTQYKNTSKNYAQIGSELNVNCILEGTIYKSGDAVTLQYQLLDATTGAVLRSASNASKIVTITELEDTVSLAVLQDLKITLTPSELSYFQSKELIDPVAYDYYLKAREYYYHFQHDDNESAIRLFQSALAITPEYVNALAGLSDAYSQRVAKFGYPLLWVDSALTLSKLAITLNPQSSEAYKAMALAYSGKGWHLKSIETYLQAVQRNPNYLTAVSNLGAENAFLGRCDEAIIWFKKGIPLNKNFPFTYFLIGSTYSLLTDYQAADVWFKKALAIQPDFQYVHAGYSLMYLREGDYYHSLLECKKLLQTSPSNLEALTQAGWSCLLMKDYQGAEQYFQRAIAIDSTGTYWYGIGRSSHTALGYVYREIGSDSLSQALFKRSYDLDEHQLASKSDWFAIRYDLAALCALDGKKTEALQWLKQAKEYGWRDYVMANRDPFLESLRTEREYQSTIQELQQTVLEMLNRVNELERN